MWGWKGHRTEPGKPSLSFLVSPTNHGSKHSPTAMLPPTQSHALIIAFWLVLIGYTCGNRDTHTHTRLPYEETYNLDTQIPDHIPHTWTCIHKCLHDTLFAGWYRTENSCLNIMPKCSDLLQLGAANHTPRGKAMLVKIQRRVEGKENEHINNSLQPMLEGLGHIGQTSPEFFI